MTTGRRLTIHALTSALVTLAGCGDNQPGDDVDAGRRAPSTMRELHQQLGPTPSSFTIDGTTGGVIRGESISLEIARDTITDRAGDPIAGPVTISLREFQSVGDMVRGDRATMDALEGQLLETSGAFELNARDAAGDPAVIQELAKVKFRRQPGGQNDRMRPWIAGPDAAAWEQPRELAVIAPTVTATSYLFDGLPFGSIGNYTAYNCDAVANLAAVRTTFRVQLPAALTAEAGVFFLPETGTTAAKLYTRDAALPGFVSYPNTMPVGVRGKLVVVALRDGKYHLFHDDAYVIPAGVAVPGGTEATIQVTPLEVSEADFQVYIDAL